MKKRILFIDHDPAHSGSTVSLEYLVRAFCRRGYDVTVHSPKNDVYADPLVREGATVIKLGNRSFKTLALSTLFTNTYFPLSRRGLGTLFKDAVKFFRGIAIVRQVIRESGAHLVYVNEHVLMQASIAAWLEGIPSVIHVRSMLLKGVLGLRRFIATKIIRTFNQRVFTITKREAGQLNAGMSERLVVVGEFFSPPQVHVTREAALGVNVGLPLPRYIVSMLGGIQRIKGTLEFLSAARILLSSRHDVAFVIAGTVRQNGDREEGKHYQACMRMIEELKPLNHVAVLGEVTNPLDVIASSDILVSTSTVSHFSRPVVEAWGLGKPVVASATEHMRDLITEGVNGFLVDSGSPGKIASLLNMLLDDENLRSSMGKAGQEKSWTDFDAVKNTNVIVDICDDLLEKQQVETVT